MVGISACARSYRDSTVGCASFPWSSPKIIWRWGVTRKPRARNMAVSSSLVFMTQVPYRQSLSIGNPGGGPRSRVRGSAPMLLVSGILENAARVVPGAVAATLDDRSLTFGQIDSEANRIANALA